MSSESKLSKELHRKVFELTLALYRVTDFFPQGEILRRQLREKANEIFGRISEYDYMSQREEGTLQILARIESIRGYLGIARSLRFVKPINLSVLEREYNFLATFFTSRLDVQKDESSLDQDSMHENNVLQKHVSYSSGESNTIGHSEIENTSVKDTIPNNVKDISNKTEQGLINEELPTWKEFAHGDQKENNPQILVAEDNQNKGVKKDIRSFENTQFSNDLSSISDVINERQKTILEHLKQNSKAKISDFYSFFGDISSKTIQRDLQDLVSKNLLKKDGEKRWTMYSINDVL